MSYIISYMGIVLVFFLFFSIMNSKQKSDVEVIKCFCWALLWIFLVFLIVLDLFIGFFHRILPKSFLEFPEYVFKKVDKQIEKFGKFLMGE